MKVKPLLISYFGKMPEEVDLQAALEAEEKKAKKEKRKFSFQRLAIDRSGVLTLRKNTTALVSKDELEVVKASLGERTYKRFVVEHGEHNPRSERPKETAPKPAPDSEAETKAKAKAEKKAKTEAEAAEMATVTVNPGKGKGKG